MKLENIKYDEPTFEAQLQTSGGDLLLKHAEDLVKSKIAEVGDADAVMDSLLANISKKHEPIGYRIVQSVVSLDWFDFEEEILNILHPDLFTIEQGDGYKAIQYNPLEVACLFPRPVEIYDFYGLCLLACLRDQVKKARREEVA